MPVGGILRHGQHVRANGASDGKYVTYELNGKSNSILILSSTPISNILGNATQFPGTNSTENSNVNLERVKQITEGAHLMVHSVAAISENEATYYKQVGKISKAATNEATAGIAENLGRGLGYIAAIPDVIVFYDNPTWGNGIKVAIDVASVEVPLYGLVNFGFEIFTKESLTNRIGNSIDDYLNKNGGVFIYTSAGMYWISNN